MKRDLVNELNEIDLKGLEGIKCGDAFYYLTDFEEIENYSSFMDFIRIIVSGITTFYNSPNSEKGNGVVFYYTMSYKDRESFYEWFKKICKLVPNSIVIECKKRRIDFHNIRKMIYLFQWNRKCKKIIKNKKERLYIITRIYQSACEYWTFMRKMDLEKITVFTTVCDVSYADSMITQKLNEKEIDTVSLQHGVISASTNPWAIQGSPSKYYLVFGRYTTEQGLKVDVNPDKMIEVGMPHYIGTKLPDKILTYQNHGKPFGVIMTGRQYWEDDIKMLQTIDEFAKQNHLKYIVKLHPGDKVNQYACYTNLLESERCVKVYTNEVTIDELRAEIQFAVVSKSAVFFEYCVMLMPVFIYEVDKQEFFEGIRGCKFSNSEQLDIYYNMLENEPDVLEKNLLDTRKYICAMDIDNNYRDFYSRYLN